MQNPSFQKRITRAKSAALGRWRSILLAAGVKADLLDKVNRPCPVCGGRDRFSFLDKEGDGNYFCRGCGGGDGLSLLTKVLGTNFLDALEFVERFCGIDSAQEDESSSQRKISPEEEAERERLRKITQLWSEASPIVSGDPVWIYLANRGLDPKNATPEVRYHKALEYLDEDGKVAGVYAAMLARVTDKNGRVVNLHRTYLENGKKANVPKPKKMMPGAFKGAFVRFGEVKDLLGLAEGIETALACRELFSLPVWATLGVTNLANAVDLPKAVTSVRIYADNDKSYAGQAGAYTLGHKLAVKGLDVKIITAPEMGTDWLDFLNRKQ